MLELRIGFFTVPAITDFSPQPVDASSSVVGIGLVTGDTWLVVLVITDSDGPVERLKLRSKGGFVFGTFGAGV